MARLCAFTPAGLASTTYVNPLLIRRVEPNGEDKAVLVFDKGDVLQVEQNVETAVQVIDQGLRDVAELPGA